jgi:hypothetical protein
MLPEELHLTKAAYYECFPLLIFQRHIYQEVRSRKETPYWLGKKAAKKRRKQKQSTAAVNIIDEEDELVFE